MCVLVSDASGTGQPDSRAEHEGVRARTGAPPLSLRGGAEGDGMRIGIGRSTVNRFLRCPTLLGMTSTRA